MTQEAELKYVVDNMTKIIENSNQESALKLAEALSKN